MKKKRINDFKLEQLIDWKMEVDMEGMIVEEEKGLEIEARKKTNERDFR